MTKIGAALPRSATWAFTDTTMATHVRGRVDKIFDLWVPNLIGMKLVTDRQADTQTDSLTR